MIKSLHHVFLAHEGATPKGTMLFLHGLLGNHNNWRSVMKRLAQMGYEIYGLDLRNHGQSFHDDIHDYHVMADDVHRFIQQHGIKSPIVLGHSMGGKVAMSLALKALITPRALVIVDIAPIAYQHGHEDIFTALNEIDLTHNPSKKQVRNQLSEALSDIAMASFLAQNYVQGTDEAKAAWRINLPILEQSQEALIDFPCAVPSPLNLIPLLCIAGAKSHYVPKDNQAIWDSYFKDYHIDYIQDAGHWPQIEQAEAFMTSLLGFLDKLES